MMSLINFFITNSVFADEPMIYFLMSFINFMITYLKMFSNCYLARNGKKTKPKNPVCPVIF